MLVAANAPSRRCVIICVLHEFYRDVEGKSTVMKARGHSLSARMWTEVSLDWTRWIPVVTAVCGFSPCWWILLKLILIVGLGHIFVWTSRLKWRSWGRPGCKHGWQTGFKCLTHSKVVKLVHYFIFLDSLRTVGWIQIQVSQTTNHYPSSWSPPLSSSHHVSFPCQERGSWCQRTKICNPIPCGFTSSVRKQYCLWGHSLGIPEAKAVKIMTHFN